MSRPAIIAGTIAGIAGLGAWLRWSTAAVRLGYLCGVQAERLQTGLIEAPGVRSKLSYITGHAPSPDVGISLRD